MLVSLHRCPTFGCPRPHCFDQPVPWDRPGGVLHWPGQSLQFWWRWTHSKWCAKSPGKCQPKTSKEQLLSFCGLGFDFFFLAFAGEVAKHAHKQELWPLSGKRTVLVDLCRQIFDANNLLILLPYNPHSMCCLNIPSVRVVQIQQVLVCSFPVVWALFNWFI